MTEEFDYQAILAERKEKADAQAREYFYHQKQRKPYYWAEGDTCDNESHNEVFFHFTDDEIACIKRFIIDTANAEQTEDCTPCTTVEEAVDCFNYSELFEKSDELQTLLGDRCDDANIAPSTIEFDTPYYFYRFDCLAYDQVDNKVYGPTPVEILLTDDEYLTLLSLQLQDRKGFCFNTLLGINAELAHKLNNAVRGHLPEAGIPFNAPFTILFHEVLSDAEAIDGPQGADS